MTADERPPKHAEDGWLRGRYRSGFEVSAFQPQGSQEAWWISFHDAIRHEGRDLARAAQGHALEVEFRGVLSAHGKYGHLGSYARSLHVDGIRIRAGDHWRQRAPRLPWFRRILEKVGL